MLRRMLRRRERDVDGKEKLILPPTWDQSERGLRSVQERTLMSWMTTDQDDDAVASFFRLHEADLRACKGLLPVCVGSDADLHVFDLR
jgi:hypothetical protein